MKQEKTREGAPSQKTFCVFGVGEREFLLSAEEVREIVDISRIFPIPGAPDYIYGALPLRGKIIPAIDLSKIYPVEKPSFANPKLLVIGVDNENIGFLSETSPFFVTFDDDIIVDDLIDTKSFFDTYRIKNMGYGKN
jgi:purine-binding chemotaxis protein CheW